MQKCERSAHDQLSLIHTVLVIGEASRLTTEIPVNTGLYV
jgi:hypothetical protein